MNLAFFKCFCIKYEVVLLETNFTELLSICVAYVKRLQLQPYLLNTLPSIFYWCLTERHELLHFNSIPSKQIMDAEHVSREKLAVFRSFPSPQATCLSIISKSGNTSINYLTMHFSPAASV